MASTPIEFPAESGLTLTLELYPIGSDTADTSVSCTEKTNNKGVYTANVDTSYTGLKWLRVRDGSNETKATWNARLVGSTDTIIHSEGLILQPVLAGSRVCTITVDDGASAVPSAKVSITLGNFTQVDTADGSGQVTATLDDATYTISATRPGYVGATDTFVVSSGNTTKTISIAEISISAATSPDQTTAYFTCYNELGVAVQGVDVFYQIEQLPTGLSGTVIRDREQRTESNGSGLVQMTMYKGGRYNLWIGDRRYSISIPASAGGTYELTSLQLAF